MGELRGPGGGGCLASLRGERILFSSFVESKREKERKRRGEKLENQMIFWGS